MADNEITLHVKTIVARLEPSDDHFVLVFKDGDAGTLLFSCSLSGSEAKGLAQHIIDVVNERKARRDATR